MDNIKLITGTAIPIPNTTGETYNFDMLDFGTIEMVCLKNSNSVSSKKIKTMMKGKSHLIVVDPISSAKNIDSKIVSTADQSALNDKPSVVLSPFKTLMPQIITPMGNVEICDNGLSLGGSGSFLSGGSSGGSSLETGLGQSGVWEWEADTSKFSSEYGSVPEEAVNNIKNWGVREAQSKDAGIITMGGVKSKTMDSTITRHRKYDLDTSGGSGATGADKKYFGPGACIFGYQFLGGEESGEGEGKETALAPHLVLSLSKEHDTTKEMKISVNPKQGIYARVGDDIGQGSLGKPQTTMLPPNCKNYENYWNCLFIYPMYGGFVISSSAVRQLSSENDNSIVIQYSDVKPPFNNVGFVGVTQTEEINAYMKNHAEEFIEWFPAMLQEASNKQNVGICVRKNNDRIDMGNKPQLEWEKSFGKFFYCPLYFQRTMKFTLYFIGEPNPNISDGESDQTSQAGSGGNNSGVATSTDYWFYPLISTDISEDDDGGSWDNVGVGKGSPIGITTTAETGVYYGKRIVANPVTRYSETNETIYKAVFEFKANAAIRYPLEVHGAVCVTHKDSPAITLENGNGDFSPTYTTRPEYAAMITSDGFGTKTFLQYATELNVNASMSGVTGNLDLDEYAIQGLLGQPKLEQCMGELCLKVQDTDGTAPTTNIFTGYGMEIKKSGSESAHNISINLMGVQKKLEDMKLIAAPFWDGDRLEVIALYFQDYCKVQLKMVDHTVSNINGAKSPDGKKYTSTGSWKSDSSSIVVSTSVAHPDFRVPRSANYRKPAVDFKTGTRCIDALNQLAEMTSCVFVVQPDGIGYFFELNEMGIPYYVEKQTNIVEFAQSDIISINISPYIENKYNTFATMGFLQKIDKKTGDLEMKTVNPQLIYTPYKELSNNFPWARVNVYVENGYMTLSELTEVHTNNVKFGISEIYQGTVQVKGNNNVTHIYQRIKICGVDFFVSSIDHRVDLATKTWTTNYGLSLYVASNVG